MCFAVFQFSSVQLRKYKIEMRDVCLNHTQSQRIVYSQIQFNEKIWSNGRKFKLWKFESKITKFHYFNFLWHALPLSYSSFTRGQNRTGELTTRGNTLYVFFCNKNIFAIATEINTLYSSKFELLLGISRRMIIGHLFNSTYTIWGIPTKFYI